SATDQGQHAYSGSSTAVLVARGVSPFAGRRHCGSDSDGVDRRNTWLDKHSHGRGGGQGGGAASLGSNQRRQPLISCKSREKTPAARLVRHCFWSSGRRRWRRQTGNGRKRTGSDRLTGRPTTRKGGA